MIDVGQQLGGYTILQRIGRGGMGDVFLAQHRRVARRAAVKVLIPELSQKATVLDRFFNEARATSLIKHPGIVEILDCDVRDGQAFIIMEFLDGESLGAYLHRAGPLHADMPFFLGMGRAVASAVGAAHATGIIHRDLKPDNVYLHLARAADPTVTVKVLDFGIAKLIQQDGGPSHTNSGMLLGTPAYMSPEQCRGAGRVDARSDVYSLGCILYEALLGSPPFVREGMGDLIIAHVSERPEPPAARLGGLAPTVNALVLRMLAKDAAHRPQTMEAVARELSDCARALGIVVDQPLLPGAPVERPREVAVDAAGAPPRGQASATPPAVGGVGGTLPLPPAEWVAGNGDGPKEPRFPSPASAVRASASAGDGDARDHAAPGSLSMAASSSVEGKTAGRVESTTFSSAASEVGLLPKTPSPRSPRRRLVAGGAAAAALVVAGVAALVAMRWSTPPPGGTPGTAPGTPPANVAGGAVSEATADRFAAPKTPAGEPAARPEPPAPAVPIPVAVAVAVAPERERPPTEGDPDFVRVDIQGVPPRTTITVDGQPASLPLLLPHGSTSHRIVLRPPHAPARVLEVDGTKDRLIDLVVGASAPGKSGDPVRAPGTPKNAVQRAQPSNTSASPGPGPSPNPTARKPRTRSVDRDAITDI